MTPSSKMGIASALSCAECEEYLADLLDGTLAADRKAQVDAHMANCQVCAELAQDAAGAMALSGRAASVEAPATLVPQILAEMSTGASRVLVQTSLAERVFGRWIRPVLQPRFALGLAMAALSVAVVPWRAAHVAIAPAKILTSAENRMYRVYDRAVKGYEDLAVLAEASNQIEEWRGMDQQNSGLPATSGAPAHDDRGVQPR